MNTVAPALEAPPGFERVTTRLLRVRHLASEQDMRPGVYGRCGHPLCNRNVIVLDQDEVDYWVGDPRSGRIDRQGIAPIIAEMRGCLACDRAHARRCGSGRVTGMCRGCSGGRRYMLRADGTVRDHSQDGIQSRDSCSGAFRPPVDGSVQVSTPPPTSYPED